MASNIVFIHDLPFQPRRELCRILDADRRWEELGGNHMNLDVTTLTLIGQAIHRDKSPTSELLNKYSERNGTIKRLFIMLAKMDHQRAMSVLQPYVEEKYHRLLRTESLSSAFLSCSKKEATSRPSLSQLSMSSNQSQWSQSRHKHVPSATGLSYKSKDIQSSTSSKFKNDFVNLNQDVSSVSLQSKMKSLDMPQSPSKIAVKKSPDLSNFKKSCNCKAETVSDNCISEKIKNVKKLPQEVQPNEKPQKQPSHIPCAVNVNGQDDSLPDIMHIPYKDICRATDNFDKARVLGRGGFGTVYKGEWKGTSVAIKRLTPNKTAPLTWSQRSHIAECITKGLNYLHTTPGKPLVHGDIKSANILLDANMDAKIGDFGLTREGPGCDDTHVKVTSVHGTECYLPPEYLRHRHLSPQVDIYSYGIVLLEIATGLRPFDPKRGDAKRLVDHVRICNDAGHLDTLRDTKAGEENMIWFRELIQIGQKCSSSDKKKRPPMQEVLLQFAKIKEEMSMVDKIRRLSNDKGSGAKALKLNTEMHLSPIELQLYYDFQKSGQSGVSGFNKLSTSPQNNGITDDTPVILDPANALKSTSPKVNDSSSEMSDSGETYDSSEYSQSQTEVVDNTAYSKHSVLEDKSPADEKVVLPLITLLQLRVSESNNTSEELIAEKSSSSITSNIN
ncbi:protein STRUBBELIG-RECEPTOR FAMILY 6-like isoform X2 [Stegodyphus dumicola]|uniref:protein STRUBBELIG-RECEPTOR FAMILY 6-like isoform X2 n=1 Tax=Stegodyphus dumicola TaxID=202533 RepID=UPI0015AF6708|nr:protein STRUBBELIG-RECEPTOR FAMILY 6-like isoform X2 [Stegodyphus dumicola]